MNIKNIFYTGTACCIISLVFIQCSSNYTYDQGLKYYAEGDTSKAIEIFKSISVSNSEDKLFAKNMLGLIYTDKHLYDLAISEFKEILSVDPSSTQIHNNLGYAYSLNGDRDSALSEFSTVLKIDPCNPFATINFKYPLDKLGIRLNVPVFIGTKIELADHLITKLDKPYRSTNEFGVENSMHDYRDYAVWMLGTLKYKKAKQPLLKLLDRNDYDSCTRRMILWALENIR